MTHSDSGPLEEFLRRAYDTEALLTFLQSRLLRGSQSIGALCPLRGHLTKDGRLLISYRAEITDGNPTGPTTLPLFLHHGGLSREDVRFRYQRANALTQSGLVPSLRRQMARVDRHTFVSAFPLDPELKQIEKLLRPSRALNLFSGEMLAGTPAPVVAVTLWLIGYRPERRAVFRVRAVDSSGEEKLHLLKLYRRGSADRVWRHSQLVAGALGPRCRHVIWPRGTDAPMAALCYPFIRGESLEDLTVRGVATDAHYKRVGRLLAGLHHSVDDLQGESAQELSASLQRFEITDEIQVLERWLRLFKKGGHPLHGTVAGLIGRVTEMGQRAVGPVTLVHRDFYPKQVIVPPHGERPQIIDVDTLAWGPAAIDVGNFLAHLEIHRIRGLDATRVKSWRSAFLRGYGREILPPESLALFELSSLVRLLCMAAVSPERRRITKAILHQCRKVARDQ